MTSLYLDGIPLPVSSLALRERGPIVSISRSGKGRKYWTGNLNETLEVEIGPVSPELGQWLLCRLTQADGWSLTQDEWSTAGQPLGVSIVSQSNPLGTHCAYLGSSVPLPFPAENMTATYWHSSNGVDWYYRRQVNGITDGNSPMLTYSSGTWHLAAGYWVGLTVTPAALPLTHLPSLREGFSGSNVWLSGPAIESEGLYSAQVDDVGLDLSGNMTISATLAKS